MRRVTVVTVTPRRRSSSIVRKITHAIVLPDDTDSEGSDGSDVP